MVVPENCDMLGKEPQLSNVGNEPVKSLTWGGLMFLGELTFGGGLESTCVDVRGGWNDLGTGLWLCPLSAPAIANARAVYSALSTERQNSREIDPSTQTAMLQFLLLYQIPPLDRATQTAILQVFL